MPLSTGRLKRTSATKTPKSRPCYSFFVLRCFFNSIENDGNMLKAPDLLRREPKHAPTKRGGGIVFLAIFEKPGPSSMASTRPDPALNLQGDFVLRPCVVKPPFPGWVESIFRCSAYCHRGVPYFRTIANWPDGSAYTNGLGKSSICQYVSDLWPSFRHWEQVIVLPSPANSRRRSVRRWRYDAPRYVRMMSPSVRRPPWSSNKRRSCSVWVILIPAPARSRLRRLCPQPLRQPRLSSNPL